MKRTNSQTILVSSGFRPETLAELRRHWHVLDIPDPHEAVAYLQTASPAPAVVVIGYAVLPRSDGSLPETVDGSGPLPAHLMLRQVLKLDADMPVIVSTNQQHPAAVVKLIKHGAFDYIFEPRPPNTQAEIHRYHEELVSALRQAVRWRLTVLENRDLRQQLTEIGHHPMALQARAPAMLRVIELVAKIAPTSAPVLITGESGTGKEVIAQAIHRLSPRRQQPFLAINCGALSDSLLASELFGHVKGAFTGADRESQGLIRQAGEGTLFLDEMASISPAFQVMLLRVLEQRVARPIGGQREYPLHCRFVAASNRDLGEMVQKGQFREDLFFRLQVVRLALPPLRERREDIPTLSHFFLTQFNQTYGKSVTGFTPEAMRHLETQNWAGNVRELRNAVERAVILCEQPRIRPSDLIDGGSAREHDLPSTFDYGNYMALCETRIIRSALQRCQGNISEAAMVLGIKRTTLHYRMQRLRLAT
jgi:DNA-binding NtrC family response regulator